MNKIYIHTLLARFDINYLEAIFPCILFCNEMMDCPDLADKTSKFVGQIIEKSSNISPEETTVFDKETLQDYITAVLPDKFKAQDEIEEKVTFWLAFVLGNKISKREITEAEFDLIQYLHSSYNGSGFILGFDPSPEGIIKIAGFVDFSLKRITSENFINNGLVDLRYYSDKNNEEEIVRSINKPFFNNQYIIFPDDCLMAGELLIRHSLYNEWIGIFSELAVPELQAAFSMQIDNPSVLLRVYELYVVSAGSTIIGRYVLANAWINAVIKQQEFCNIINFQTISDEALREEIRKRCELFSSTLSENIKVAVQRFIRHSGSQEITKWIFTKSLLYKTNTIHTSIYNSILRSIRDEVFQQVKVEDLSLDVKDIGYLEFLANKCMSCKLGKEFATDVYNRLINLLQNTSYVWNLSLNQNTIRQMRSFAAMQTSRINIKNVSNFPTNLIVKYEGLLSDRPDVWSSKAQTECYLFSVFVLTLETAEVPEADKGSFLLQILELILHQIDACPLTSIVENYYFIPLLLVESIADQVLINYKDQVDLMLSKQSYHMLTIMRVFDSSTAQLSEPVLNAIKLYQDFVWATEKECLIQANSRDFVLKIDALLDKFNNQLNSIRSHKNSV